MTKRAVLKTLLTLGAPPWRRLGLAAGLGVASAFATIGLLAGSGYVVDRAAFRPGLGAIAGLLAAVEVLAFLRAPLRYGERLIGHDAAFRSLARWRVWLYDVLEPRSPAGLRGWRSGDLLARAIEDVDTLQDLTLRCMLPLAVAASASTLGVIVVTTILPAAGVALLCSLLLAGSITFVVARATHIDGESEAALQGRLVADIADLVQSAAELSVFEGADAMQERIGATESAINHRLRRRASVTGLGSFVITASMGAAVIAVLWAGVDAVSSNHLGVAMLAVLPLATIGTFESIPAVGQAVIRFQGVLAAGNRLLDLDAIPIPIHEPDRPIPLADGVLDVTFTGASLRYGEDLPWVFEDLNLEIPAGDRVAITGASGSGKSSLLSALLRFWPLSSGDVRIGGVSVDEVAADHVRARVALVDQQADLFAGTIAENVALGRPDASAGEIDEVLTSVGLGHWVDALPDGSATQIGEGGAKVSGGERRRLAVARALLAGGEILVLDEPTAGLDGPTADRLLADVEPRFEGRTVLLVTHRRRDVAGFDRVFTINHRRRPHEETGGLSDASARDKNARETDPELAGEIAE